jgi:chitodextrinase
LLVTLCLGATLIHAAPAGATTTVTVGADADAYVRSSFPGSNYGIKSSLAVDADPEILQTYLRFVVPPGQGSVVSAHLRLFATDASGNGGTLSRVPDTSWGETTITYSNRPALGEGVATVGVVPLNDWVDLDVTSSVTAAGPLSFAITTTGTNGSDYSSRQHATVAHRPQLVVEWSGAAPDSTPPTVPGSLTATPASPTSVDLAWTASSDDTGVTGYGVYRDDTLVATLTGTSWTDTGAEPATTYHYAVDAVDAAGNRSAKATADATTPPNPPTGNTVTVGPDADAYVRSSVPSSNTGTKATLEVDADPEILQTYLRFTVPATGGSVTSAHLKLYATDASGNGGSVYAVADTSWGETTITWSNRPALGGSIVAVGVVPLNGWVDLDVSSAVTAAGPVSFAISTPATNGSDYASRQHATADLRPQLVVTWSGAAPDTTAPSIPGSFTASATSPTTVEMSWEASTDDTGVTGYGVYRDDVLIATVTGTSATDDAAVAGATHHYEVDAVDAAGNRSAKSVDAEVTMPSGPSSVTLSPDADSYVRSAAPAANYGTRTVLSADSSPVYHTYLRFSVPGWITSVTSATLRLWVTNATANGGNLRSTTAAWSETGLTWNNRPVLGPVVTTLGPVTQGHWTEVDVTSAVTAGGAYGFAIEPTSSDGADFDSKEGTNGPQLVVVTASGPDSTPPSQPQHLVATATAPTSVSLSWTASTDEVGVTGYVLLRDGVQVATPAGTSFTDTSVEGDHTYVYEVEAVDAAGNRSAASAPTTVTTPPASTGPVTVVAVGDISCDPSDPAFNDTFGTANACHMRATRALVDAIGPEAVLALGDQQEQEGTIEQYMAAYDQVWGVLKPITKPVPGNQEYDSPGAAGYYQYFGALAGEPGKGYYSVDIGTWHLIALNSNCAYVSCAAGSAQEQWLRADLAAHPTQCTVAMFHHPRFSSRFGTDPAYEAFWEALDDFGADLVLNGHAHFYERFAPQTPGGALDTAGGIRQFVVGTGGASHANFRLSQPNSEVRNNGTFGVLRLDLLDGGYDWEFVPEAGATFTDAGSGTCH